MCTEHQLQLLPPCTCLQGWPDPAPSGIPGRVSALVSYICISSGHFKLSSPAAFPGAGTVKTNISALPWQPSPSGEEGCGNGGGNLPSPSCTSEADGQIPASGERDNGWHERKMLWLEGLSDEAGCGLPGGGGLKLTVFTAPQLWAEVPVLFPNNALAPLFIGFAYHFPSIFLHPCHQVQPQLINCPTTLSPLYIIHHPDTVNVSKIFFSPPFGDRYICCWNVSSHFSKKCAEDLRKQGICATAPRGASTGALASPWQTPSPPAWPAPHLGAQHQCLPSCGCCICSKVCPQKQCYVFTRVNLMSPHVIGGGSFWARKWLFAAVLI